MAVLRIVPANREFRDGISDWWDGSMKTIEERKAAERQLAESHARFYEKEAVKDSDYLWLAEKWQQILKQLQ